MSKSLAVRKTSAIINSLLKENTGRAMLDSGDHYGRNWQRNQTRVFHREPAHTLKFSVSGDRLEIEAEHNLYHFLKRGLEFDPEVDRELRRFARKKEHREEAWLCTMEAFADEKGWDGWQVVNSYNGEDMLSQIIQYLQYDNHILLQVHGGCDARGGYSSARAFIQDDDWLYNNARAMLAPVADYTKDVQPDLFPDILGESPWWSTYNGGYSWESSGTNYKNLGDYPVTTNPEERKQGVIFIDEDQNGYCPLTGRLLVLDYFG